jgi:hypothetical protein
VVFRILSHNFRAKARPEGPCGKRALRVRRTDGLALPYGTPATRGLTSSARNPGLGHKPKAHCA